jgi:hypothetical protein
MFSDRFVDLGLGYLGLGCGLGFQLIFHFGDLIVTPFGTLRVLPLVSGKSFMCGNSFLNGWKE